MHLNGAYGLVARGSLVRSSLIEDVKGSLTQQVAMRHRWRMVSPYKNSLKYHAYALSAVAKAYSHLANRHRVAASAIETGKQQRLTADDYFTDWIFQSCELVASAEWLLALEVDLARKYGVTWDEIAAALGVSRQAAWERFSDLSRRGKSRQVSQVERARKAKFMRHLRERIEKDEDKLMAFARFEKSSGD